jgi:hypothetical protein
MTKRKPKKEYHLIECDCELCLNYEKGKSDERERILEIIRKLRKKSDRCSECDGCNCDLCMLEFVELRKIEEKK